MALIWLLHRLHCRGAVGGDECRGLQGPVQHPARVQHLVHEPDAFGACGVDQSAREQQVHGVDVADLLHQLHRGAAEGVDGPAHLGQPEARVPGCQADVR